MKNLNALVIFCIFFISCQQEPVIIPYALSTPKCKIGENKPWWMLAGVEFEFYNTSQKEIKELQLHFLMYDADTKKNPFIGSNIVELCLIGTILSQSKTKIGISLDPYIHFIPEKPLIIDHFTLDTIRYTDGSCWDNQNYFY